MIELSSCHDASSEDSSAIVFAGLFLAYLVVDVAVCSFVLVRKLR
jgi:hypothetical protein